MFLVTNMLVLVKQSKTNSMKKDWKEIFTHKVVAPLTIGHIVGVIGYVFEFDPLLWIGIGLILYGYYVMVQG